MALSNDLISQFVKITKDNTPKVTEATMYGTVVKNGSIISVQLDGSDVLTPVSTTTNVEDGERVTVLIKNHAAVITGNITSPSARTEEVESMSKKVYEFDEVVTTKFTATQADIASLAAENVVIKEQLKASEADISDLKATDVTITDTLTAANAEIEKLKTDKLDVATADITYATIKDLEATNADIYNLEATYGEFKDLTAERLTAAEADIDTLEATKIDATTAEITYAKISDLNAATADIDTLEADVAEIDTLIFGSASGSTIQTSFANAVIAQLGDAQIKSATIENVSASKITSGDIITNSVRVMSEDGKLLISDETMQISDASRVRVQIGKDAAGDYSINIWDENGNLMFSKGGITDSAIKDSIIRNDMVSDTANIAAHKLDIDSLFEAINGSSKTITSSRIYLDDEGQTLDVAFESVTTDIDELQNELSSQGTQITAVQGQITSKVWQNDIDVATTASDEKIETLSNQYSSLEQEVDNMTTTIASHTSEISKKADSTTVTEVSNKVTSLEADLSGFRTTVSNTYVTQTEVDDLTDRVDSAETNIAQNTESIGLMATKKEVESTLDNYSTTSEMNAAIQVSATSITNTVKSTYATISEVEGIEIGGRNLFSGYLDNEIQLPDYQNTGSFKQFIDCLTFDPSETVGEEYTISFWAKSPNGETPLSIYNQNESPRYFYFPRTTMTSSLGTAWEYFTLTITNEDKGETYTGTYYNRIEFYAPDQLGVLIKKIKVEKGNKATDWTPAPEDMATSDDLSTTQSFADLVETRVTTAETLIEQLSDSIAILVRDANGESLMVQTEDGWTFSTANIQEAVDATSENLDSLINEVGDVNSAVEALQQAVSDLGILNDYVKIGSYEDEPCIELGETDSDFKLIITNTRIMFMEGSGMPAYISNQSLHIKKAVVEEELQQGEFVWKIRSNGNLGLVWKGVTS